MSQQGRQTQRSENGHQIYMLNDPVHSILIPELNIYQQQIVTRFVIPTLQKRFFSYRKCQANEELNSRNKTLNFVHYFATLGYCKLAMRISILLSFQHHLLYLNWKISYLPSPIVQTHTRIFSHGKSKCSNYSSTPNDC